MNATLLLTLANIPAIAIAYSCIAPLLLGFATVGFGLLSLAYRYQLFFVISNRSIDMKGRAYARGLQQLTVGVYLAEFCLIGLFAIASASNAGGAGPLVLMIIFTVFTIVYHVIMKKTLGPIIDGTELAPLADPHSLLGRSHSITDTDNGMHPRTSTQTEHESAPPVGGIRGKLLTFFFHSALAKKFFYPNHGLASHFGQPIREYSQQEYDEAYLPPAITSQMQVVWIARDEYGLSHQEVAGCERFDIPASDAEAILNEKVSVQWDEDRVREAPIYEAEVPY